MGRSNDSAHVARVLEAVERDDPVSAPQKFGGPHVQEREDPHRPRRGGEGRDFSHVFRFDEEITRRLGRLRDQILALGQKQPLSFPMLLPGELCGPLR